MRTLLFALVMTAVLWWLFRPRPRGRRADRYAASLYPTYRPLRAFRTPGGVATTVYEVALLDTTWAVWRSDCGGHCYESDGLTYRDAQREAVAHHLAHGR